MKTYTCPLGRIRELQHEHPERTAYKLGVGLFPDYIFQVFTNRKAMAKCIRMQQKRASHHTDWHAVVKLTDGEGY